MSGPDEWTEDEKEAWRLMAKATIELLPFIAAAAYGMYSLAKFNEIYAKLQKEHPELFKVS